MNKKLLLAFYEDIADELGLEVEDVATAFEDIIEDDEKPLSKRVGYLVHWEGDEGKPSPITTDDIKDGIKTILYRR